MLDKSAPESKARTSGPLSGFRIVEFAGIGPGPFACMLLADMGADVVTLDRIGAAKNLKAVATRGRKIVELDLKDKGAITQVLDNSRGDWGDGVFFAGGYEVAFGGIKHGGRNFLQIAKVAFVLEISAG